MRFAITALVLVLFLRATTFVASVWLAVTAPGDVSYPEGAVVYSVRRVASGLPLYQDYRRLPHVPVPYSPTYFYAAAWLMQTVSNDPVTAYTVCRLTAVCAHSLLGVLCAVWARDLGVGRAASVLFGLSVVASQLFWGSAASARADSTAVLATTLSVWMVWRCRSWSAWAAAIGWTGAWLVALLAWSCKQSSVALGPAIAWHLYSRRGWRAATLWALAWSIGLGVLWAMLHDRTDGLFTLNAVQGLSRPIDVRGAMAILRQVASCAGPVLAIAIAASWNAIRDESTALLACWFVCALSIGAVGCLGEGAATNYFLEAWTAGCLLAAGVVRRQVGAGRLPSVQRWAIVVALATAASVDLVHTIGRLSAQLRIAFIIPERDRQTGLMPRLLPSVGAIRGAVLLEYPYLAVRSGRPPVVMDVLHYRQLVDRGIISAEVLATEIERKQYELVVLGDRLEGGDSPARFLRWPHRVWKALGDNYRYLDTVDGQFLYVPK